MPTLHVTLEEPAWPEITGREIIHYTGEIHVTGLPSGMESGATSVALRFDLEDGRVLVAETSLALFLAAGRSIAARWPSPAGTGENAP